MAPMDTGDNLSHSIADGEAVTPYQQDDGSVIEESNSETIMNSKEVQAPVELKGSLINTEASIENLDGIVSGIGQLEGDGSNLDHISETEPTLNVPDGLKNEDPNHDSNSEDISIPNKETSLLNAGDVTTAAKDESSSRLPSQNLEAQVQQTGASTSAGTHSQEEPVEKPKEETITKAPKRKRLTLQERLALAAKGRKVSTSADSTPNISRATSPQTIETSPVSAVVEQQHVELKVTEAPKTEEQNKELSISQQVISENYILKVEHQNEIYALKTEAQELKSKNQVLTDSLERFRLEQIQNLEDSEKLRNKLLEREDTVRQLMEEGETLSRKELKLNDVIKKLRIQVKEVEESNKVLLEKKSKLDLIEETLTLNGVKTVSELAARYNEVQGKSAQLDEYIDREKLNESKIESQSKFTDNIIQERDEAQKKNSELTIQLELFKKQSKLEIDSKDLIINQLKQESSKNKREKNTEIQRLEEKIELLRLETESNNGPTRVPLNSSSSILLLNNGSNDSENKGSSRVVEYDDYVRLSNNHHSLQAQYLQSQETWKLLESNLSSRVDRLTQTADSYRKSNAKLTSEFKKLEHELQTKVSELDTLKYENKTYMDTIEKLKFNLQLKQTDLEELEAKFDNFKTIYNIDREKLNLKIENLTRKLEEGIDPNDIIPQTAVLNSNYNGSQPSLPLSSRSSQADINAWQDSIGLGESSSTPVVERTPSYGLIQVRSRISSGLLNQTSLLEANLEDEFGRSDEETSTINGSHSFGNVIKPRHADNSSNSISNIPSQTNIGSQHIMMLNKMGSSIRRLEVELSTLKEENAKLLNDKEHIQKELLSKLKLDDEIDNMKQQIDTLKAKIEEKEKSEKTMLEVIGEKSEQVDELTGDLDDLKDLLKTQVQQYVDLQEKLTSMH